MHPTCNAYVPCCHLWTARLYKIFSYYLINGTIIEKKLLGLKCAFWFSLKFLSGTFFILRRIERDMIKNVYWSSCKVPVIIKPEFSRQIFEKSWNVKYHKNPSSGSRRVPRWQTDRRDEAIVAFRNIANAPKNVSIIVVNRIRIWSAFGKDKSKGRKKCFQQC